MERISYAAILITQGKHKFYSLTIPSEVLAQTSFVTSRYDDPIEGFQRTLDTEKAKQIADYVDNNEGTIPTAIILSAQTDALLDYNNKKKTIEFNFFPKAFLILDGQHRVYGFNLAKSSIRVPAIVYAGLSRKEESRLFIDINTKQRPVPNELLLDIKALAEYENESETSLRDIFDLFNNSTNSSLLGKLSPSEKIKGKISRVTFNAAVKPITIIFGGKETEEVYTILNNYLKAIQIGFKRRDIDDKITNPFVFRSLISIFPDTARKVKDKYNSYSLENFNNALVYFFDTINTSKITKKLQGHKELTDHFLACLKRDFTL